MKLKRFEISGYRRIKHTVVILGDATFIIGENNVGKSAVLKALELFFSGQKKLEDEDYFFDENKNTETDTIILTAEFTDLPNEIETWHGFKGRVLKDKEKDYIIYRKTYPKGFEYIPEMKVYKKTKKEIFEECKKTKDFVNLGVKIENIIEIFGEIDEEANLTTKANISKLAYIEDLWDYDFNITEWEKNPGGIQGNITIKLPRFLLIPAEDRKDDIESKTGALQKTMSELFKEVRDSSNNYKKAQEYLNKLATELDPSDQEKDFGKMLSEINSIIGNVFPESTLHIETQLDDADKVLNPKFQIEMSSNVKTKPERQGTGTVRSAAFALLRYREHFLENKRRKKDEDTYIRNLIIGFEEPEMYLHPNAANNMRDEIYELSVSSNSQIVCTTHSPYMIDLSKDLDRNIFPNQILNLFRLKKDDDGVLFANSVAFNVTEAYKQLIEDDKDQIKLILKLDDYVSRVFFSKSVIIVEGDTEDIVLRETIKRLPCDVRKKVQSNYQIIKARGKAAIIALIRYLKSMDIEPFVIHDKDKKKGAIIFNEPIKKVLSDDSKLLVLENCLEDVLGYNVPTTDKPFFAYRYIKDNWEEEKGWDGVIDNWKEIMEELVFKNEF